MVKKPVPATKRHSAAEKSAKKKEKTLREVSLSAYLTDLKKTAVAAAAEGDIVAGACLVTNPVTGQRFCVQTDSKTCKDVLKGRFVGGLCGGG